MYGGVIGEALQLHTVHVHVFSGCVSNEVMVVEYFYARICNE